MKTNMHAMQDLYILKSILLMKKSRLHAMQDLDIKVHLAHEEERAACNVRSRY